MYFGMHAQYQCHAYTKRYVHCKQTNCMHVPMYTCTCTNKNPKRTYFSPWGTKLPLKLSDTDPDRCLWCRNCFQMIRRAAVARLAIPVSVVCVCVFGCGYVCVCVCVCGYVCVFVVVCVCVCWGPFTCMQTSQTLQ